MNGQRYETAHTGWCALDLSCPHPDHHPRELADQAPRPEVIDARRGGRPHECRGSWQYAGLNHGGHEVYACGSGRHVLIGPHVAADHECSPECADARKALARPAQVGAS